MGEQQELQLLLRSRFPILVVETPEENRFLRLVETVANLDDLSLYTWSVVRGLRQLPKGDATPQTRELREALGHIARGPMGGIFVFHDAQPYLEDPVVVRTVREIAQDHARSRQTTVFLGSRIDLPPDLQRMSASFRLAPAGRDDIRKVLQEEAELYAYQKDLEEVRIDAAAADLLVQHLVGLSRDDARRMIRQALENTGTIAMDDVARVLRVKHESLGQGGSLQLVTEVETFERVGGQAKLKKWVDLRRDAFLGKAGTERLDLPRGVMLLGVQGAGKSLAARALAGSWRVPLLRLDFGALYNKFHGETERNLRAALETAAQMQPCILWMDEIEKGVASGSAEGDSGVSRRVLGTLLTWMSERRERVFLVATANDIGALPAELLRKGRFDEIFFVDLPDAATRAEIFRIHLLRRGHVPASFDLRTLAEASDRFSGAEIEQAIIAGAYTAHSEKRPLETRHVLQEIANTRPLAVVRAEEVSALRRWAENRTVRAD